jgi:phosphate uptake regulator
MKRKIIKLGTATLVVSLPAKWTKKFNLKQGNELETKEEEKRLVISTKKEFESEKATIDITEIGSLLNYSFLGLYLKGVDELRVESENPELIETLHEKPVGQLIGWEIIEQGKNHCVVKDVSGAEPMNFKTILRRVFLIIKSIAEEIEQTVEKGKTDLSHIDSIDRNANRFAFLCGRKLNKAGYDEFKKTPVMYYLTIMLEATGDLYRDLAEYITEKKVKFSKKSIELLKRANTFFNNYQKLFFDFNQKDASDLDSKYRKFKKEIDLYIDSIKNTSELRSLIFITNIADYIAEMMRNQLAISL